MEYITVTKLRQMCFRKNGKNPSKQYLHQLIEAGKLKPLAKIGRAYIFSSVTTKRFLEKYFPKEGLTKE